MHAPLHSTTESQPDRRRWFALAVIVTAQFMVVLDVAIVNVALPTIKTDLGFSQENLQWVVTAYSIMFGGVLLLGGRMADLLGRRRLFMAGLTLFTRQLAARRARLVGGLADRLPRPPGARRGAALPGRAVDPHDHLPRGQGAQLRARDLGRRLRQRRRGGRAARRRAHQLARAGRGSSSSTSRSACSCSALTPRLVHESVAERGPPALRRAGRRLDHRRADAARVRDDPRRPARLGHDRDDRAAGGLGRADRGLRRHRAALEGAAAADADVPLAHAVRLQPGRAADGRRRVLAVLPAHAVHAAGAALLGAADGRGLHRADADDHRLRERLAEARPEGRDPARAGGSGWCS